jgi:glycosyltransferase involved in cell wall biosynthesis
MAASGCYLGRPLRILQVPPQFDPSVGGVENHTREVSRRLVADGFEVEVLTADQSGRLPKAELIGDIPTVRVQAFPRGGDQLFAPGIARRVSSGRWDVVHVQCYHTFVAPLAMAAAARSRIPYLLTFHGGGHTLRRRNRMRRHQLRALRPLLARAAVLVATAEWEIEHYSSLLSLPRDRFRLIPNGGDLPPVSPAADGDGTVIISIGRVERFKGHHHAIAALPHVLREIPDARLWVAGDGPYESELVALAERLRISDRVEIFAERDRAVFGARLAGASLATLLSEFETHPMAATEALALGVPTLVGDDGGGLTELARKGLVRSVSLEAGPAEHAAAMVRAIREPLPPTELTLPSWDECYEALRRVYLQLHQRRESRLPTVST